MPLHWQSGPLADGLHCYMNRRFWHAHEHWEAIWLQIGDPEKNFLQALIQMTAAFHHLQQGNRRGAVSLLGKALDRVATYPSPFGGIHLALLREDAARWLAALEQETEPWPLHFPRITLAAS